MYICICIYICIYTCVYNIYIYVYIYIHIIYVFIQLEYCIRMHCIRVWGARIQGGLHIFSYTKHFKNLWNRIAKFWNYCLYVRFAIPLCGSLFFWWSDQWPLMVLWDEIGFCRKTIFQAPKKCFLRTCLDCFQSTQNLYMDRLGDLKDCFSQ